MKWSKTKYPGIRYREHETRKHGSIQKDRYFAIRYQLDGKRREEGLGWTSEGWTAEKAAHELSDIKKAHTPGKGAASLAEKRELEKARREKQIAETARFEKDNLTFREFFTDTYLPIAETSKKKRSYGTEEQLFRLWISPQIGNTPVKGITAFHMERIKKAMLTAGKSARTIQYAFATVRQVWNMARRSGIVKGDCPTKAVKPPKIDNRRLRFLSHEEAHTLLYGLAWWSEKLYNISLLSLHTGLRAGEIFNLQWGHVDFARGLISIVDTKSGRNRAAYMTG
ncbi:MAG: site-specific integrase, partial [Pseudomonadota bacterium]